MVRRLYTEEKIVEIKIKDIIVTGILLYVGYKILTKPVVIQKIYVSSRR